MPEKKRIEYIDTAKAIAILLVIIGHSYWIKDLPRLQSLIYSFHMPLFFLISGFFVKDMKISQSISKYAKAYLWPYLVVALFILLIGIFKSLWQGDPWYSLIPLNTVKILWGSAFEVRGVLFGNIPHIGPSWFLLALFFACVMFVCISKLKTTLEQAAAVTLLACFSICSVEVIQLPLSLQGAMVALLYIYIGAITKRNDLIEKIFGLPGYIKLAALALWLLYSLNNEGLSVGTANIGHSIVGFTVSLIGSFFVLWLCKVSKLTTRWIGRNTLAILCAHVLIWRIFDIFGISARQLTFAPELNFIIESALEIVFALALAWLFAESKILKFDKLFKLK